MRKIDIIVHDGYTTTLQTIDDDDLDAWHRAIKCETMQGLTNTEVGHLYGLDVYLDDNGKLYGQDTITGICVDKDTNEIVDILLGNLVFARHDIHGNSTTCVPNDVLLLAKHMIDGNQVRGETKYKIAPTLLLLHC